MVQEIGVQSQVESYERLKKWYLMPPCLALRTIRWGSRVKWINPGNGVAPSPTPRCSSYWKGNLQVLRSPTLLFTYYNFRYFSLLSFILCSFWLSLFFCSFKWFEWISVDQCSCLHNLTTQLMPSTFYNQKEFCPKLKLIWNNLELISANYQIKAESLSYKELQFVWVQ